MADFHAAHPELAATWKHTSNSVIILEAGSAAELTRLWHEAHLAGLPAVTFREPDLGDEVTAVAFAPDPLNRKRLANLPLAGKHARLNPELQEVFRAREKRLNELSWRMAECEQTKGQSVLQHGASVREHYLALVDHLHGKVDLNQFDNWRLPDWVDEFKGQLRDSLVDVWVMERYLTMHDCGKPEVREVDADGRVHFPNHAEVSARVFAEHYADEEQAAWLVAHDMDAHMLKAVDVPEFAKNTEAVSQMLAALAEVTSNASMFGGIESTSFKIKWKQLNQRGKAMMKDLFPVAVAA